MKRLALLALALAVLSGCATQPEYDEPYNAAEQYDSEMILD